MTMRKCSSSNILTGKSNGIALIKQGCISHIFSKSPIHRNISFHHFNSICKDFFYLPLQDEILWRGKSYLSKLFKPLLIKSRFNFFICTLIYIWSPIGRARVCTLFTYVVLVCLLLL